MIEHTGFTRRTALVGTAALGALAMSMPTKAKAQSSSEGTAAVPLATPIPVMPALTAYIADAQTATIPADIQDRGRLHILDTLASIIACRNLEAGKLGRAYAKAMSGGGRSSILGSKESASLIDAVFAGAMTAHAAEINDFIPSAYVQPGPSIVSGALALAEARELSGKTVLNAVVVGYELAGRMPKTIGTSNLQRAGMANHGIAPVFGTGAMAASALGMSAQQINHVISYCAQQASGSWQWLLDVRHIEKAFVFAGMGARNGLQAALMVEQGFTGVPDCLDVEGGWLRSAAFAGGDSNRPYLIEDLGSRFELTESAFKKYPSGGPTQPAVEALLDLRKQVRPEEIVQIRIAMPGRWQAFRDAAMPALNLTYLASIIMLDGKLDFVAAQSLDRMHNDTDVARFRKLVEIMHDPAQEAAPGTPRTESARVTIKLKDKPAVERYVPFVTGFPSHPMSREELVSKTRGLISEALGDKRTEELIKRTEALDEETDMKKIISLVTI